MKPITFRDVGGARKTISRSAVKIAWRWFVRFITTGMMLFPLMAGAQTFGDQGVKKVTEYGAGNLVDIAAGRVPGYSAVHKFGNNLACSTSEEDIWSQGGQYQFPISTSVVQIAAGGNAADTAAGAGARSIQIEGLGTDWLPASARLDTNGASASLVSTVAFSRVNRAFVVDVGTYSSVIASAANVGQITVISTETGHTMVAIVAAKGQSQMGIFTIPANKTGYLMSAQFNTSATISTTVSIYKRENADDVTTPFSPKRLVTKSDELRGSDNHEFRVPIKILAKTDIWATCLAASGSPAATAEFDIVLEDN